MAPEAELVAAFSDTELRGIICAIDGEMVTGLLAAALRDPSALDVLRRKPRSSIHRCERIALPNYSAGSRLL